MAGPFIRLTSSLGRPILVNLANVESIEPEGDKTRIVLPYLNPNSETGELSLLVEESFEEVAEMVMDAEEEE